MHLDPGILASYLSVCVAFASLIFVVITFSKNSKKDVKSEMEKEESRFEDLKESIIKVNIKLDGLCTTANETRTDVKTMNKDLMQLQANMTSIEARLTTLEKTVYER